MATVAMTKSRPSIHFFGYKNYSTNATTVRLAYLNGYGCKEEYVYLTVLTTRCVDERSLFCNY